MVPNPLYISLVQGRDGNFYGTTESGGVNNQGIVFRVSADGKLTTLYNFCSQANCPDGASPYAGLTLASDGNFYGTTEGGGNDNCNPPFYGCGTVFRITPAGTLTTLHTFAGYPTDGAAPFAGLMQATDGNLYGTTFYGGDQKCYLGYLNGCGTVFEITLGGTLTTMYNFDLQDGAWPAAGLIEAADGNFYGTTFAGGDQPSCGPEGLGCGTVFKITSKGSLISLHSFASDEGNYPYAGVVQAADGNFYGTTNSSGLPPNFLGTAFKITPSGTLTSNVPFHVLK